MTENVSRLVILPDGNRVNLDNIVTRSQASDVINFTMNNGSTFTYTDPASSAAGAAYVMAQLDVAQATGTTSANQQIATSPYTISSISPDPFDISNPGSGTITITGSGFTPTNIGKMHFEDAVGGMDSNGYAWTCTYVNPTKMTAVFDTTGDSDLSLSVIVYYQDSTGLASNALSGTASGTVVTI
jgi:hypothetical protein